MLTLFEIGAMMLALSAVFGWINHAFLKLPHTIGLLIMALVASFVLLGLEFALPNLGLTETVKSAISQIDFNQTVMNGMLAFLLFAGALHVDMAFLKSRRWAIGIMATIGVLISTAIIGLGFFALTKVLGLEVPFIWALVFGALISPTDPVAVLSILKTVNMPQQLEAKIAGESLFNDGVGVVVFTIILAIALGTGHGTQSIGVRDVAELFLVEAVGGAILGFIAGWIAYKMMAMIDEHAIEILITLGVVAGTYALAGRIEILGHHLSGPISVVVAGLLIGNKGAEFAMSEKTRTYLFGFWEMIDEILNSVLFLLIGLEILILSDQLNLVTALTLVAMTIPLVLFARFIAVLIPMKFLGIFKSFTKGAIPVLTWGGVRGGISVALALSLPDSVTFKPIILSATYGVVVFSIIVQGLTVKTVVRKTVDPTLL
ncbi:MAG TPA: sodium:proton antiporter [Hellea balneolensis]|uniref:Sodium:proton antiporter n=1 Tax=Hellea balneolensis TaxID=287478 RepID=A0A7C5QZL4_9PROT|nr:sodium:proton antiporter [Hellea balneolensis]